MLHSTLPRAFLAPGLGYFAGYYGDHPYAPSYVTLPPEEVYSRISEPHVLSPWEINSRTSTPCPLDLSLKTPVTSRVEEYESIEVDDEEDRRSREEDRRSREEDRRSREVDRRSQEDCRSREEDRRLRNEDRLNREDRRIQDEDHRDRGDCRGREGDRRDREGDRRGREGDCRGREGDRRGREGDCRGREGDHRGREGDHRDRDDDLRDHDDREDRRNQEELKYYRGGLPMEEEELVVDDAPSSSGYDFLKKDLLVSPKNLLVSNKELLQRNLLSDKDLLQSQRNLLSDKDLLQSQRNLLSDKDLLQSQRNLLLSDKDLLQSQRDLLLSDKDLLQSQRDLLLSDKDLLQRDLLFSKDLVSSQRDLLFNKDLLASQRDLLLSSKDLSQLDLLREGRTETFLAGRCEDGTERYLLDPKYQHQKLMLSPSRLQTYQQQLLLTPQQQLHSPMTPPSTPSPPQCPRRRHREEDTASPKTIIPRKKKHARKLKFDEDTSSPVSGTVILGPDEAVVTGDIDPAFNIVEVTDEARAELAKIENRLGPYQCKLCRQLHDDAFQLAQHRCSRIAHVEYRCPECDKRFSCPANLASHRRWHKPRVPAGDVGSSNQTTVELSCTRCDAKFTRQAALRKHMVSQHPEANNNNTSSVNNNETNGVEMVKPIVCSPLQIGANSLQVEMP